MVKTQNDMGTWKTDTIDIEFTNLDEKIYSTITKGVDQRVCESTPQVRVSNIPIIKACTYSICTCYKKTNFIITTHQQTSPVAVWRMPCGAKGHGQRISVAVFLCIFAISEIQVNDNYYTSTKVYAKLLHEVKEQTFYLPVHNPVFLS